MFKDLKARASDFIKSFRVNGWGETLKLTFSTIADFNFDKKIGISTERSKYIPHPVEFADEFHKGSLYLPTRGVPFLKFLKKLNLPKHYTFVDIGCGRGRVLWLAKSYGFVKVVGVEIDGELSADAEKNLSGKGLKLGEDFEVYQMNAANYLPKSDKNIFYFYGPYISDKDLNSILKNLTRKKSETGADQFMIYHCNVRATTPLDSTEAFEKIGDEKIQGNRYFIYKAK